MSAMRLQLEAVGLGSSWVDGDLDAIAEELGRRRGFAGDATAGGRAILLAAGLTEWWRGDFIEASRLLEQVRSDSERRGDAVPAMLSGSVLGMVASLRGERSLADREFERALEIGASVATRAVEVTVRAMRIAMEDAADRDVVAELERCRSAAVELDRPDLIATVDLAEGWSLASDGRFAEADTVLRRATAGMSAPLERSLAMVRQAEVLMLDGRLDEARDVAATAVDVFGAWRARYWTARASLVLGAIDGGRDGRRIGAALVDVPDDPAYLRLFEPAGSFVVDLDGDHAAIRDGAPLTFLTRHAEAAVRLLAASSRDGLSSEELSSVLWPDAAGDRVAQRFRTMLWQVRSGLGPDSWRLQRRRGRVMLDLTGIEVVGRLDREELTRSFAAGRRQTSSGSYSPRS